MFEAQVFKLHLDAVDAEPVGDRRIDVERLTGDAFLLVGRHRAERLHVVQAIRQLDEDDTNVLDHRQHHLAETFCLGLGPAVELDLVQLAHAVNDERDVFTELRSDLFERCLGVFDDIVQDRGTDGLPVEVHVRQFLGDRDRVSDVWLARFPGLALMGAGTEFVGFENPGDLVVRQVGFERVDQLAHAMIPAGNAR